jgi:hypothetical protein
LDLRTFFQSSSIGHAKRSLQTELAIPSPRGTHITTAEQRYVHFRLANSSLQ